MLLDQYSLWQSECGECNGVVNFYENIDSKTAWWTVQRQLNAPRHRHILCAITIFMLYAVPVLYFVGMYEDLKLIRPTQSIHYTACECDRLSVNKAVE